MRTANKSSLEYSSLSRLLPASYLLLGTLLCSNALPAEAVDAPASVATQNITANIDPIVSVSPSSSLSNRTHRLESSKATREVSNEGVSPKEEKTWIDGIRKANEPFHSQSSLPLRAPLEVSNHHGLALSTDVKTTPSAESESQENSVSLNSTAKNARSTTEKSITDSDRSSEDSSSEQPAALDEPIEIAQSTTSGLQTGDRLELTPVRLPNRAPSYDRFESLKAQVMYRLPGRMFFSAVVDNSLRLETNVFQTANHHRADMVYRILPNTTLGYALTRTTRVSTNYFFLRDQYTHYNKALSRNFHSVGFQIDQDIPNKSNYNITLGFLGRALFVTPDSFSDAFFNDLLPQITVSRIVGQR